MATPITVALVIDTDRRIAGVEFARDAYNAANRKPVLDAEGAPVLDGEGEPTYEPGLTSEQYIMFVAVSAVDSYARQQVQAAFDEGNMTKNERDAALAEIG